MVTITADDIGLDIELLDALERFIDAKDEPPHRRMTQEAAVNVIVRDWLVGQGYMALPDDPGSIPSAEKESGKTPEVGGLAPAKTHR